VGNRLTRFAAAAAAQVLPGLVQFARPSGFRPVVWRRDEEALVERTANLFAAPVWMSLNFQALSSNAFVKPKG
jgi:hypothetical protein